MLAAEGDRGAEARASAEGFLAGAANADVVLHEFRDGFMPYRGEAVKETFEGLKDVQPDLVFTHTRDDLHQDHRLACELTWNTFRDHLILEYEVPKVDGDLGHAQPVRARERGARPREGREARRVVSRPRRDKHWFDTEIFLALMRLRGMECRSPSGYAEAFVARKVPVTLR